MTFVNNLVSNPENLKLPDRIKRVLLLVMKNRFVSTLLAKVCPVQTFLIQDKRNGGDSGINILFFGHIELAHYFSKLFFSRKSKILPLGKTPYSNMSTRLSETTADIAIVSVHGAFSGFLSQEGFLISPLIRSTIDLSNSLNVFYTRLSEGRRRDIHVIEKLGYTYEITREPGKFNLFYKKMYLPYTLKRHQESSSPTSFSEMKKYLLNGGLLLVKLNDEYVSGLLYQIYDNQRVLAKCTGAYERRDGCYAKKAIPAALYFLILWSKQQGYDEIDLRYCVSSFMKDGVLFYKREWGVDVRPSSDIIYSRVHGLKLGNFGSSVRQFLIDNPVIFENSLSLKGLVFLNNEKPTEGRMKNLHRLYYTPGLSDLVVISCLGDDPTGSSLKIVSEGKLIKEHPVDEGTLSFLRFFTEVAPNESFDIYLIRGARDVI